MKYNVEFTFTGAMKCKILFCSHNSFLCGCDTCKSWLNCETGAFTDQEGWTFGNIQFEESPQTKSFEICSHHAMYMNLVPFNDTASRNVKDLDLMVFGSDLGGTWTDTVMVDGQSCSVNIRVFDPANPTKITKTVNKLEFQYTGQKKCKMVYTTLSDCGCESCKWLGKYSTATFADHPETKYGTIWFETTPYTTTYNLCSHHVIATNLTPFDDDTVRNKANLDVIVSGSDLGGVWEDEVEIDGMKNNVTIKVYAADAAIVSSQNYSLMPKKTRKLEFTFSGTKKAKMVFTIATDCGCSTCQGWSRYTTASFVDNPDQKYGFINFETSPYTTTFDICSRHEMKMNLVPFLAEVNKAEDLDVLISGAELNGVFTDTVEIDGELNTIKVKVLKAPKAPMVNSAVSRTLNQLELNFTGSKKSRLLYSVDPELDCDCDNCKWWIAQATDTFGDKPNHSYGYFNMELSPYTKTYDICSNNVMYMNLVDFEYIERMAADLDMQVFGSDVGCSWTDKVMIDGSESVLKIDVKAPLRPLVGSVSVAAAVPAGGSKVVGGSKFNVMNRIMNAHNKSRNTSAQANNNNNNNALLALQMQNMVLTQNQMVQNLSIQQAQESVNNMQANVNNYAAANAEVLAYAHEVEAYAKEVEVQAYEAAGGNNYQEAYEGGGGDYGEY
ncbi:hypothetical protein BGZ76_003460 [Entomortierella beljakovae]|nr:hypothetical protein BGZ76_003460 [Entomortierella beljakovae]